MGKSQEFHSKSGKCRGKYIVVEKLRNIVCHWLKNCLRTGVIKVIFAIIFCSIYLCFAMLQTWCECIASHNIFTFSISAHNLTTMLSTGQALNRKAKCFTIINQFATSTDSNCDVGSSSIKRGNPTQLSAVEK